MLEAGLSALQSIGSVETLTFLMIGVLAGLVVGVIPGLGGVTGVTLLIPLLFGMDPITGIAMLIGMNAASTTSDTYSSVLIGVPGSAGSQATILDGHALARKGQADRALGASFSASMIGGLIGAVSLLVVIVGARSVVQALGSPELLMFTLVGLATVGVLVGGDPILGMFSAAFGVMLGTVGGAPATVEYRYVFGELYLYGGLSIVLVSLGLFAFPELISLFTSRSSIAEAAASGGGRWQGLRDTWRNKGLVAKNSLLGTFVGAIPGVGGGVIDWIAYGITKQTVKDNSQFGKGDVRGVIAPDAAGNAKEGGTLIPTLILGIPGSGTTAIMLGGLILMGVAPGPPMLDQHLDVTLGIVWSLVIANTIATAMCFGLSKWIAKITFIPGPILAPLLLVVFVAAAFQVSGRVGDLVVFLVIGVIGYVMKMAGVPRAPALIGYVLALNLERYLHLSISRYGMDWLTRPAVIVIGVLVIMIAVGGPLSRRRKRSSGAMSNIGGVTR